MLDIYTVHVKRGDSVLIRENFKANSLKRAYQLAEDKLWSYFKDRNWSEEDIDDGISDSEFECIQVQHM